MTFNDFSAVTDAITREQVRQGGISDWRLELLTLVHKQRALLLQPFTVQNSVRSAYAKKYLETDVDVEEYATAEGAAAGAIEGPPGRAVGGARDGAQLKGGRPTIFAANTDDVTLLGKRQDLSLVRIETEAAAILAEIHESNSKMKVMLQEEQVLISTLWHKLNTPDAEKLAYQAGIEALEQQQHAGNGLRSEFVDSVLIHQLPASLGQVLLFKTVAPVEYAVTLRYRLQQDYFDSHVDQLGQLSYALNERFRTYFGISGDAAYNVPADYTVWLDEAIAMAPPTAATTTSPDKSSSVPLAGSSTGGGGGGSVRPYQRFMAEAHTTPLMSVIEARISLVQLAIRRASDEQQRLDERIRLSEAAKSLIARRTAILAQKQQCEDGGRERLLSKKPNAAKQLLAEEVSRRAVAKELPKVHAELTAVLTAWEDAVGQPMRLLGAIVHHPSGSTALGMSAAGSQKSSGNGGTAAAAAASTTGQQQAAGSMFQQPNSGGMLSPRAMPLGGHMRSTNTPPPSMPSTPVAKKRRLDTSATTHLASQRPTTTPMRSASRPGGAGRSPAPAPSR